LFPSTTLFRSVALDEGPAELIGEQAADGRLAGARDAHEDDDHGAGPPPQSRTRSNNPGTFSQLGAASRSATSGATRSAFGLPKNHIGVGFTTSGPRTT